MSWCLSTLEVHVKMQPSTFLWTKGVTRQTVGRVGQTESICAVFKQKSLCFSLSLAHSHLHILYIFSLPWENRSLKIFKLSLNVSYYYCLSKSRDGPAGPLLPPLLCQFQVGHKMAGLCSHCLYCPTLPYPSELLMHSHPNRSLLSALCCPPVFASHQKEKIGKRCFSFSGLHVRNSLPLSFWTVSTFESFRSLSPYEMFHIVKSTVPPTPHQCTFSWCNVCSHLCRFVCSLPRSVRWARRISTIQI